MDGRHGIVEFDIAGGVMNLRHVLLWAFGALSPEFGDFLVLGITRYIISLLFPRLWFFSPSLLHPLFEAGRHHEVLCPRYHFYPRLCRSVSHAAREARHRSGVRYLRLPANRRLCRCLRKRRPLCDHQGETSLHPSPHLTSPHDRTTITN